MLKINYHFVEVWFGIWFCIIVLSKGFKELAKSGHSQLFILTTVSLDGTTPLFKTYCLIWPTT